MLEVDINSVSARNFNSFPNFEVDFEKLSGIWQIVGENHDGDGFSSNGAGKSTILEAIWFALFGESIRGAGVNDIVRRGESECEVKLVCRINGKDVTIVRGRKNKKPVLVLEYGEGKETGKAAEAYIQALFGADGKRLASWLMILSAHNLSLFSTATDSERKDLLLKLVTEVSFQRLRDMVREDMTKTKETIVRKKTVLEGLKNKIKELEGRRSEVLSRIKQEEEELEDLISEASKIDEKLEKVTAELTSIKARYADLQSEISELSAEREETVNKLEKKYKALSSSEGTQDLEEELEQSRNVVTKLLAEVSTLTSEEESLQALLDKGKCPECGQDIREGHGKAARLPEIRMAISQKAAELEKAQRRVEELDEDIRRNKLLRQSELDRIVAAILEAKRRSPEEERLLGEVEALEERVKELEREKQRVLREGDALVSKVSAIREKVIPDLKKSLEGVEDEAGNILGVEIPGSEDEIRVLESMLDIYEAAYIGFSPKGIPAIIVGKIVAAINSYMREYSRILTGGTMQINLVQGTTTKAGKATEKVGIEVVNASGGPGYDTGSLGERRRVDLAVMLSLIHFFRDFGVFSSQFIGIDEVTDNLDKDGVQALRAALRKLNPRLAFVISHSETDGWDGRIRAIKSGGVSRVEVR